MSLFLLLKLIKRSSKWYLCVDNILLGCQLVLVLVLLNLDKCNNREDIPRCSHSSYREALHKNTHSLKYYFLKLTKNMIDMKLMKMALLLLLMMVMILMMMMMK